MRTALNLASRGLLDRGTAPSLSSASRGNLRLSSIAPPPSTGGGYAGWLWRDSRKPRREPDRQPIFARSGGVSRGRSIDRVAGSVIVLSSGSSRGVSTDTAMGSVIQASSGKSLGSSSAIAITKAIQPTNRFGLSDMQMLALIAIAME